MQVFHARKDGASSESRSGTFTGTVWGDPIMPTTDNVTIGNVFFTPGARTHWHQHELGQMLNVIAGSGWVCLEGQPPQRIRTGDVVWIRPHERHWHGADKDSYMLHTATSIGNTDWSTAVTDDQYPGA